MKVLITGNMGYVGPRVLRHLRSAMPEARISGFDTAYFAHCLTASPCLPEALADVQYFGDVREFPDAILEGVDAIVHLSAISNDPMGNKFETVTDEINRGASVAVARKAFQHGVRRFVFASSCSVYGQAEGGARKEGDPLNPLTAYARSKIDTERGLEDLAVDGRVITCLRFATACGMSDRLRLDLVLNDFVACALASREITILSDGSPWRPLIDVQDMARAIHFGVTRDISQGGAALTLNVGSSEWNFQVIDLARAVARAVPATRISVNPNAAPDKRSYRVDFSLFARLAPRHQPQVDLDQSIREIKAGLEQADFHDKDFRSSYLMRLKVLERHIAEGRLTEALRWTHR